jgi:hypothetical protein
MAIGLRLKFPGGSQEQYIAVDDHLDVENRPPQGPIFDASGPNDGGWGVLDFWHTRNDFDQFAENRLMPAVAELGDRRSTRRPTSKSSQSTTTPRPRCSRRL